MGWGPAARTRRSSLRSSAPSRLIQCRSQRGDFGSLAQHRAVCGASRFSSRGFIRPRQRSGIIPFLLVSCAYKPSRFHAEPRRTARSFSCRSPRPPRLRVTQSQGQNAHGSPRIGIIPWRRARNPASDRQWRWRAVDPHLRSSAVGWMREGTMRRVHVSPTHHEQQRMDSSVGAMVFRQGHSTARRLLRNDGLRCGGADGAPVS